MAPTFDVRFLCMCVSVISDAVSVIMLISDTVSVIMLISDTVSVIMLISDTVSVIMLIRFNVFASWQFAMIWNKKLSMMLLFSSIRQIRSYT